MAYERAIHNRGSGGNRVAQTLNGVTTYFVGAHYERTGASVAKYYFAGRQRVAIRKDGDLSYILGDHLGSTNLVTTASGVVISEMRYSPWGEVRYAGGVTPTRYTYTGQYSNTDDFGLMFYNARWYDPQLGRFAQADTIIPLQSQGVQAWDRYAYVNSNPVRYSDPSGHRVCDDQGCPGEFSPYKKRTSLPPSQPPQPKSDNRACTGQNQSVLCLPTPVPSGSSNPILPVGPLNPITLPTPGPSYHPWSTPTPSTNNSTTNPSLIPAYDFSKIDGTEIWIDGIGLVVNVVATKSPVVFGVPSELIVGAVELVGFSKSFNDAYNGDWGNLFSDLASKDVELTFKALTIGSKFERAVPYVGIFGNVVSLAGNLLQGFDNP